MKSTEPNTKVIDALDTVVQSVVLLATAYVTVVSVLSDDQLRTIYASILLRSEKYCQKQAETWAHMADTCKNAYDKTRLSV